ncbi:MAG: hypothetical protein HQM03_20340 [Magnetococcales bacterium]|nr:hypothetical protein [Magnetococcales bacterium]
MAIETLEELLKKKMEAEQIKSGTEIDWDGRKKAWMNRINGLFDDIEEWLKPIQERNLLIVKKINSITLNEEYIGSYIAPILDMFAGTDRVSLTPIATLIVGSYGRIDMTGPKGRKVMLIISDTDSPATVRIRVAIGNEVVEDSHPMNERNMETRSSADIIHDRKVCKWYFVDPSERTHKTLVTKESFEKILMAMLQP